MATVKLSIEAVYRGWIKKDDYSFMRDITDITERSDSFLVECKTPGIRSDRMRTEIRGSTICIRLVSGLEAYPTTDYNLALYTEGCDLSNISPEISGGILTLVVSKA